MNVTDGRAGERDVVVVVEADQLAELQVPRQRGGLARDALHHVAVAGHARRCGGRRCSCAGGVDRGEHALAPSPCPTALANPCPSGPVVASTPGVWWYSGMTRRPAAQLAERLQVVERQVVAGQVEQRVEQHRCVAGAESTKRSRSSHCGSAGSNCRCARPQRVGRGGGAERHARVARVRLLDRVDGQEADRVDAFFVVSRVRHTSPGESVIVRDRQDSPAARTVLPDRPVGTVITRTEEVAADGRFRTWRSGSTRCAGDPDGVRGKKGRAVDEVIAALDEGRLRVAEPARRRLDHTCLDQARDPALLRAHGQRTRRSGLRAKDAPRAASSRRPTSTKCRPNGTTRSWACAACRAGSPVTEVFSAAARS